MGKRVPNKNRCITVNLFHDGVFTLPPFQYAHSDEKQITDIDFEGMSFVQLRGVIRKLVQGPVASLYYCKVGTPLRIEHNGYDALDIRDQGETLANDGKKSSDAYWSSDEEDLSYVDFHTVVNDNVVIKTVTTNDPFLNKLCDDREYLAIGRDANNQMYPIDWAVVKRLVAMNRVARTWEHSITPSIKKRLELLKEKQRDWMVIPMGFHELKVRKGHEAYGVNIHLKQCMCRMWELSVIPCVHSVAAYSHMIRDPIEVVYHWVGRKMTYTNYQETCHNKSSCKIELVPKQPKVNRPPVPKPVSMEPMHLQEVEVEGQGVVETFKTLCLLNYALMIRHDYDITSSLRRGALQ
nr:zinc finger, PMZ-type [Tanacetum cinerariifolium]